MPIVVPTEAPSTAGVPPPGAPESLVFDGLDFAITPFVLTALSMPPPRKRPEWAEYTDGDGALLIRDPLFENRTIEATLEVHESTRDLGQAAVGQIVDKLEEADRNVLGIPLVWTPANSTDSLTFHVLTGEIIEYPITVESGYFANGPVLTVALSLTCRPFGYGAEIAGPSASGTGVQRILNLPAIPGDVPAEARLVVTDTAGQSRDYVCWGLEQRYNNGSDTLLNTPDLTVTGFAGTSTTRSGSISTNVFRGTLTTTPVAVCGTGDQPHIGSYRVFARYWASGTGVRLRVAYRDGDGPLTPLLYATPPVEDDWCETDLGIVTITPALLGAQRWQAQIEAYTDTPGDTIDIDFLALVPVGEGYGKARRPVVFETPTTFLARDEFDQTAGALAGKTLPAGGTWSGAGDADDFQVAGGTAERTATLDTGNMFSGGRFAIAGSTNYATVAVGRAGKFSAEPPGNFYVAVGARWVDINNFFLAGFHKPLKQIEVVKRIAGSVTSLKMFFVPWVPAANEDDALRLQVDAAGRWFLWLYPKNGHPGEAVAFGQDTDLATGGVLATGKPVFYDFYGSGPAVTRNYDDFVAFAPTADAAIFANQSLEFRHNGTEREDSTGVYGGPPKEVRSAPFFIPPAGVENRTSRVVVMARRNDIETLPATSPTDSLSVQAHYTPRYLVVPR